MKWMSLVIIVDSLRKATQKKNLLKLGLILILFRIIIPCLSNRVFCVECTFRQIRKAQTKLVRATTGVIYDVFVDIRVGSPTYGKWEGYILSEYNHRQLLVPKGFAHGFVTLTPNCNVQYKVDEYYSKEHDGGIAFDDPTLRIAWPMPVDKLIISDKDTKHPTLSEFE